jgi:ribosomal protein S27AE
MTCYTVKSKDAVLKRIKEKKIICPRCGGPLNEYKAAKWSPAKQFFCGKGHVTSVYPFANNECNIAWSDKDFINIDFDPKATEESIKSGDICCPVVNDKREVCGLKLKPVDNSVLEPAKLLTAKTKVRVGDVWDRQGCPEPKSGHYDKDFNFHESEFHRRNKVRIKALKKTRLTKAAGEIMDRPTKKSYRDDNHKKPTRDEI